MILQATKRNSEIQTEVQNALWHGFQEFKFITFY